MITQNLLLKCCQVSDQWAISEMSCGIFQEPFLNYCWLIYFSFFSSSLSLSCYLSSRGKVHIMTAGESHLGEVILEMEARYAHICGSRTSVTITPKIVFIYISWYDKKKSIGIMRFFNEKSLTFKILIKVDLVQYLYFKPKETDPERQLVLQTY